MFFSRSNMQLLLIVFYNDHCDYQENISLVDEVLLYRIRRNTCKKGKESNQTRRERERGKKKSLSLALDDLRGWQMNERRASCFSISACSAFCRLVSGRSKKKREEKKRKKERKTKKNKKQKKILRMMIEHGNVGSFLFLSAKRPLKWIRSRHTLAASFTM